MQFVRRMWAAWDTALIFAVLSIPLAVATFSSMHAIPYGVDIYKAYVESPHWSSTHGTIVSTSITKTCGRFGRSAFLEVKYTYQVNDQPHLSDRIWFGNGLCASSAQVKTEAQLFPPGMQIRVFYNPLQPSSSVLIPGTVENGTVFFFLLMILASLVFAWPLIFVLKSIGKDESQTQRIDAYLQSRLRLRSTRASKLASSPSFLKKNTDVD